jgi:hypothetical protein
VYFDTKPCRVCGSDVELKPAAPVTDDLASPVGPADGFVGDADSTPDERVCTNPGCPTNGGGEA